MMRLLGAAFAWLLVFAASPLLAGPPFPVPEPVSLSLLAIGVGGTVLVRALRKRR